ncbi:Uncharacterised protein [Legionella adelaidensis]|uniref:Opacity protein and related surface antigens n=1 Tax=Legionella adelaidensis TaxID=45056 RepID=A0A0W0R6D3_9GAMM|nr:hypothetical protein [Legionella adelaidensis]KTC66631.1 hypothetical protein Lade_1289 [Legionella adelaidensis]VEH81032.1 Uncharacterised protein [Legionella adelaidensis]
MKKSYLIILCLGFHTYGLAKTLSSFETATWVSTLSAGFVWANPGETQSFSLAPQIEKTYFAINSFHRMPAAAIFLGKQKTLTDRLSGQFGLEAAYAGDAEPKGQIWDDADPIFNNYTYNYKIEHAHLALKGKLLIENSYIVIPWISAGIGVAWNHAYYFVNQPIISEALTNPDFTNRTTTSFTYNLGIGFQKGMSEHWQWGLGYEFADWGKSQLGRAPQQILNSGIKLNHLYTNGVLFNLSYIA